MLQEGPGSRSSASRSSPAPRCRCRATAAAASTGSSCAAARTSRGGDDTFSIDANESTFIPLGTKHRLANSGAEPLLMIEVQCGDYVGEDDIVRFDDVYGRARG